MPLAKRVIPVVLYDGTMAVKSLRFHSNSRRNVGSVVNIARVYSARQVDELCLLDVAARRENRGPDLGLVETFSKNLAMTPFTVGGGVRSVEDVRALLQAGADKVAVGAWSEDQLKIVRNASEVCGCQALVAVVDAVREGRKWFGYEHVRARRVGIEIEEWLQTIEAAGAGEVLLQSVDHDGTMDGFDLDLIKLASKVTKLPLIACGGAGTPDHFVRAAKAGADAVAGASIFHFTQTTPRDVKVALQAAGYTVRLPDAAA